MPSSRPSPRSGEKPEPSDRKADQVDGAIGELSPFHETFGYYAQGVSISTAVLPDGWRDRLVVVETASTAPGRGHLLDPDDCVVSKLVAGREKDYAFAAALIQSGLVNAAVLAERIETVDVVPAVRQRLRSWISSQLSVLGRLGGGGPAGSRRVSS